MEHIDTHLKQPLRYGKSRFRAVALRMFAKIFKVSAVVKNLESAFMSPRAVDIFTQPGAAPDHLHKLDFGTHQFKENQI